MAAFNDDDREEGLVPIGMVLDGIGERMQTAADESAYEAVQRHKRSPPAAMDHERAVLGGILLDSTTFAAAVDAGLLAEHFYRPAHGLVYAAIGAVVAKGSPVDCLTVTDELLERGQLDKVGGAAAIAQLEALMPTSAHVGAYAVQLVEYAQRRRLLELATAIASQAYAAKPVTSILSYAARESARITVPSKSPFAAERARARAEVHELMSRKAREVPFGKSLLTLARTDLPPVVPLIQGLVGVDDVVVLGGGPKGGKTWVEADIAIAVGSGFPVFNEFQVRRRGRVLMFVLEDGERALRKRARALAAGRDMSLEDALSNIAYEVRPRIDLLNIEDVVDIIASARLQPEPPLLVCIDPLVDAHTGDENDNGEMRRVMGRARVIRDILGCAVLIVHHMIKNSGGKPNEGGSPFDKFRGASSIRGAYDVGIAYDVKSKSPACIKSNIDVEMRDGADPGPFGLQLTLEEDSQRHLHRATWTFWRDREQLHGAAAANVGDAGAVHRLLEMEWMKSQRDKREPERLSANSMSGTLGKGWPKAKVGKLAHLLVEKGMAVYFDEGRRSGYVYSNRGGDQPS